MNFSIAWKHILNIKNDLSLYLVYPGLDNEQLDERARVFDGSVDVLERLLCIVEDVVVLCKVVVRPQQGRRTLQHLWGICNTKQGLGVN